ncbi:MAG: type VI secretion system baseplate subunit TssG [Sphingomonadaceae bacterium]
MSSAQRPLDPGLIQTLREQPYRFEFFQAMRLLAQQQPVEEIRLGNRLALAFPPSQLGAVAQQDGVVQGLTPAFLGLLGSTGTLPLHYTQRLAEHERSAADSGPRAFLDLLAQRSQQLFYLAWAHHRPECLQDDGEDIFRTLLMALAGVAAPPDGLLADDTLARYALLLRSRTASAPVMAACYSEYFGVPVTIEPLAGGWQQLPPLHQAQLGVAHVSLGVGMLLGQRLYRCDARVRLRLGPLERSEFERFLPDAEGTRALAALLRLHCGVDLQWDVRLQLRGAAVVPLQLGAARLGIDSWLVAQPGGPDRDDTRYTLQS